MNSFAVRWGAFALLCFATFLSGCNRTAPPQSTSKPSNRVVLYCSVDEVYAKPLINELEQRTGLRIDALFDTEATKTAGLTNRIRAEKAFPRGDVFWSSALLQTLLLKRDGLLQPYASPSARDLLPAFKDKNGYWAGLGARKRVMAFHQSLQGKPMVYSLKDLQQPRFKNRFAISNPQFGTASDWVAALGVRLGPQRVQKLFIDLKRNGLKVLPGNSDVVRRVARGELLAGVTDMDDYEAQAKRTKTLFIEMGGTAQPDSEKVYVPGSVAMLKGAPHPEAARKLIDALIEARTELELAKRMQGVQPLRNTFTSWPDESEHWPAAWDKLREPLAEILLTP